MNMKYLNTWANELIDAQLLNETGGFNLILLIPFLFTAGSLINASFNILSHNNNLSDYNNTISNSNIFKHSNFLPDFNIISNYYPTTQIIDFNNIMFYLAIILFAVNWIIFSTLLKIFISNIFKHNIFGTILKLILTFISALILIFFAYISFKSIYLVNQVVDPSLVIHEKGLLNNDYLDFAKKELNSLKDFNNTTIIQMARDFYSDYTANSLFDITRTNDPVIPATNGIPEIYFEFQLPDIIEDQFIHYDLYRMENRPQFIYITEDLARGEVPAANLVLSVLDPSQVVYNPLTHTETPYVIVTQTLEFFPESYFELALLTDELNQSIALQRLTFIQQPNANVHSYDNAARALVVLFRRLWITYLQAKGIRPTMLAETEDEDLV